MELMDARMFAALLTGSFQVWTMTLTNMRL